MTNSRLALALAFALIVTVPAPGRTQDRVQGDWGAEFRTQRAHINLNGEFDGHGHSNYGRTFPMSDLKDFSRSGRRVSFRLVREAGTIAFEGTGDDRRADGTFVFDPSPAYRQQMASLGYQNVTPGRLFIFAMGDLSIADIKEMEKATTDELTTSQLVRMVNHGVDPEFVRGIAGAGFRSLSSEQFVRTRDHGVTPDYIAAIRKLGNNLMLEDYIRARDHGVSEDYVEEMQAAGFKLNIEQLVNSRDHGVSADDAREFAQLGYRDLTIRELVRLRDHGVSSDFALDMKELGYKDVGTEDLITLKNHGVSPAFIRRMNKKYNEKLAISELVSLRNHGEH